jgi:hypothetical protein
VTEPEPEPLRKIVGAAALVMRATGERWAALVAREDLDERELEAPWAEDAELLCAALGTLGAEREG